MTSYPVTHFGWPHIRSAILDDATSGRPSWNDDIARDFYEMRSSIVFQLLRSWKWREHLVLNIYLVFEKMAGKSRNAFIIVIRFVPGGSYIPQNHQNGMCPQRRLRSAWAFWKWRENLDLNIYLVNGNKWRENLGSPLSGSLCISYISQRPYITNPIKVNLDFPAIFFLWSGADNPQGTKFWCQQKPLVTSVICYKFQNTLFEVWYTFFHDFNMYIAPG